MNNYMLVMDAKNVNYTVVFVETGVDIPTKLFEMVLNNSNQWNYDYSLLELSSDTDYDFYYWRMLDSADDIIDLSEVNSEG